MRTLLLFFIGFLSSSALLLGQRTDFQWAKQFEGYSGSHPRDVAVDGQSNIITVGFFYDTVDFDPGPAVAQRVSQGLLDIFIAKLDPAGNLLWVKTIGGAMGAVANAVGTDSSGNIYVTGSYQDSVNFGSAANPHILPNASKTESQIFIAKFSPSGSLVWAHSFGGVKSDFGEDIFVAEEGTFHITGGFQNTVDFDPNAGVVNIIAGSSNIRESFVAKFDKDGNLSWAKALGGILESYGTAITVSPQSGRIGVVGHAGLGAYIIALESNGNQEWRANFSADLFWGAGDVAIDLSDNFYATGSFDAQTDFDPSGQLYYLYPNSDDAFLLKLDSTGNFVWAHNVGGSGRDIGSSLATDDCNHIYLAGTFQDTVDFDPHPGKTAFVDQGWGSNAILKFDSNGTFRTVNLFKNAVTTNFGGPTIALTDANEIVTVGSYFGTADFDPDSSATFLMTSKDTTYQFFQAGDVFIQKMAQCIATPDTQVVACNDFFIAGQTFLQSGNYTIKQLDDKGCDTITHLDLTVHPLDTTVFKLGRLLTSNASNAASYQWVDCFKDYKILPGDTQQVFSAPYNGNFAVIVDNGFCSDTSQCVTVTAISQDEFWASQIEVFPNPARDRLQVSFPASLSGMTLKIRDVAGGTLLEMRLNKSTVVPIGHLATGVYLLELQRKGEIFRQKIVKK